MRSPIYVEPADSNQTSPVNLPIFLSNKHTKSIDSDKPCSYVSSLSPASNSSKRSTIRLTKTTTTKTTTTTSSPRILNLPVKPISLVIKHDYNQLLNEDNRSSKNSDCHNEDQVETFEIAEKYPSAHRKSHPKPPIIAYSHNLTNQNNNFTENKSNFRTRRNSIILNLDKYVVNSTNNNSNSKTTNNESVKATSRSTNSTNNKMVNIPLAPKKYHTFNENESPSHKEIKNKIVLSPMFEEETTNDKQDSSLKQIFVTKPLKRTGSNLNTGIKNIQKPLARRPPKEFLSATITPSDSNDFKLTSTTATTTSNANARSKPSRDSFNQNNNNKEEIFSNDYSYRTTSPTMKSLPSYDEALKRVSSDTNKLNKLVGTANSNTYNNSNNSNNNIIPIKSNLVTSSSGNNQIIGKPAAESNGSAYIPSLYTNTNNTPVFKNRNTLPNLHMQSTFKSLLVQPAGSNTTTNNNSNNLINGNINNNNNTNGTKVYFRPQDLNSSNRLIQIQQINDNKSSLHLDSFKHHLHSQQHQQHHSQQNQSEVYAISKHSPVHQSVPQLMTNASTSTPIIVNKSVAPGKKLSLNVITDDRSLSSPIKDNTTSLPPPTPLPMSRQPNIDISKPIVNNNKILPASTLTTTTCNNYIATKTTSSISTTTMTTTENFNSIKQRTPSPGFLPEKNNVITQVESPTPIPINNASQKSKSWSLLNNNSNNCTNSNSNNNKIGFDNQENKNLISDRTSSLENRPQSSLTNWKSTATASTLITSPFPSDPNLNRPKRDSTEEPNKFSNNQIITIRPTSSTGKLNEPNYNLISSGKLVDAVKAATTFNSNNSVEDGLGLVTNNIMPNLIKKNVNSNKTSSKKPTHVNLGFIEDDDNAQFILNENNRILHQQRQQQQHQLHQQQQNRKVNKNSLEDTISSSFSSSSQSSYANENNNYINSNTNNNIINNVNSINNSKATNPNSLNSKATRPDESLNNLVSTESKREYSRPASNNNMASNLISKSSSQTTDTNLNNIFNRNRNKDSITTATTDQVVTERPPGRLNYYDSDTMSEGFMANAHRNLNNKKSFNNRELNGIMSDSPNLSDLSEGRFDDINGGHRTSTPNMSKQKRSASLSTPEIKHIKKQIQDLEKMYHEILKIIDTDKNSLNSLTTSRSSSSSYSSFNNTIRDSSTKKRAGMRSVSQRNPTNKSSDINYLKHRFNRMESHLTSLAKTVAQISVELRSMKSVEAVIANLKREIQEIKNYNSGLSNSNKPNDLFRSNSEPQLISSINVKGTDDEIMIKEITCNKLLNRNIMIYENDNFNNEKKIEKPNRKKDSLESDKFQSWTSWSSSYTNPLKLKKLTKFFGQEPPMLRLFLSKLNYEIYLPNFESEHITITELPYLSEDRLRQIGIPLGPRLRILQEAQASFRNDQLNNYLI